MYYLVYFIKYPFKKLTLKLCKIFIFLYIFRKLISIEKIYEIPMIIFLLTFYFQNPISNCRLYGLSGWKKCPRRKVLSLHHKRFTSHGENGLFMPTWLAYIFSNPGFIPKFKIPEVCLQLHKNHSEVNLI